VPGLRTAEQYNKNMAPMQEKVGALEAEQNQNPLVLHPSP
jgi:hypothetical protein